MWLYWRDIRTLSETKHRVARSGHRPKFKNIKSSRKVRSRGVDPLVSCLYVAILLSTFALTSTICDSQAPIAHLHRKHRQLHHDSLGKTWTSSARYKRHFGPTNESMKVAALASRLEQWFACHRFSIMEQQQQQQQKQQSADLPATGSRRCAAHFDGHLCWPATEESRLAKVACPRLYWLSGQQKEQGQPALSSSLKSVIDSINLSQQQTTAQVAANNASSKTESIMATDPRLTFTEDISSEEAKFAYRKCSPDLAKVVNLMLESVRSNDSAQWQLEANYSDCNLNIDQESDGFDPTEKWIKLDEEADKRLFSTLVDELERIEDIDPYSDPDLLEQWTLCIRNVMRHQNDVHSSAPNGQSSLLCPIIFDGWRCWPSTKAGETAYVSCPSNQPGFSTERKAYKICTSNGTWYRHPDTSRYWSNYTTCVDTDDLTFREKIVNLNIIGNSISLVALSGSLIIFISFKVTIHKNLFLSFITNNLMWIIWYTCVVNNANLLQSNPLACRLWHILNHYFLVSNYFWMFCEGLYLHTLLLVAFVSEDKILKWFYLLGWITPVPITIAYAYNRSHDEYYTNFCWMEESPYNLILMAPIGISLLLNLVFLINIVRVLVTKLRANNSPDTHQTRKAVRATLILIPLLGLHYILTPFRPEAKSEWEGIYESVAAVCTSFQGLCVALLFCFCNAEVITVIKKKLKDTCNFSHSSSNQRTCRSNTVASFHHTNNNNFNNKAHQASRSVILSSANGQLMQRSSVSNIIVSHGTKLNNSNSSSLLTNLTASPIHQITTDSNIPDQLESDLYGKLDDRPVANKDLTVNYNQRELLDREEEERVTLLQNSNNIQANLMTTSFSVAT